MTDRMAVTRVDAECSRGGRRIRCSEGARIGGTGIQRSSAHRAGREGLLRSTREHNHQGGHSKFIICNAELPGRTIRWHIPYKQLNESSHTKKVFLYS
jgi:hypothetical protein